MKGYSQDFDREKCAAARLEGVDASYKDLSEVCGRVRKKTIKWALEFLEKAANGSVAVLYKRHNKRLGHRRELSGRKGRYPKKAALVLLGALKSAMGNARAKGLSEDLVIVHVSANKKATYPRMASKGRRARADYELSRIEIILTENQSSKKDEKKTSFVHSKSN